jgi:uncharacterized protein involved in cysteine biosynthesis
MTINWLSFVVVFLASIVSACVVVVLFATAIRLFATPPRGATATGVERDEEMDDVEGPSRPAAATAGGVVLFVLCGLAVLYGIYLIVPAFHH